MGTTNFANDVQKFKDFVSKLGQDAFERLEDGDYLLRVWQEACFQNGKPEKMTNQPRTTIGTSAKRGRPLAINREVIWEKFWSSEHDKTLGVAKAGCYTRLAKLFKITPITTKKILMENEEIAKLLPR